MSYEAQNWATSIEDPTLKSGPRFVLFLLANMADPEGWCYPGIEYIARATNMGNSTVRRHLQTLVSAGYVAERVERRRKDGSRTSDLYRLSMGQALESSGSDQALESSRPSARIEQTKRSNRADQALDLGGHEPSGESPEEPSGEPSGVREATTLAMVESNEGPRFEGAWLVWPRKVGKGDAVRAWMKAMRENRSSQWDISIALGEHAKAYALWPRDDRQFVPHLATWLNGRRWEDEDLPEARSRERHDPVETGRQAHEELLRRRATQSEQKAVGW